MPQRNLELVIDFLSYKLSQKGYSWSQFSHEEENRVQGPERAESEEGSSNATNSNPSRHQGDSPMVSGAAGHNRSLDAPDVIPMVAVKQALREAGDNFERRYRQAILNMTAELCLTPETAHHTFEQGHGGWDTFVKRHVNNVAVNSWMHQESFNYYFLMGMTVAGVVLLDWLFSWK
ncbi:bcl-2-like protein 1 isoform X1 [Urocitellus parryii]|uniref:bcl-2-like protein 1 isoform X1 n=1 Tax=Urocitellus parryii TaxID=9999 RepID=UPI000E558C7A|nr:bcl-2-like protein 1 isoform X1 [Urocitellus parryii]